MRPFVFLITTLLLVSPHLSAVAAPANNSPRLAADCNGLPAHKIARPAACNRSKSAVLKPWLEGFLKTLNASQPAHKTALNNPAGSLVPNVNPAPVPAYPAHKTARP
ncbi:MAG: hypothetical protein ACO1RX_09690 [Candidatus Sericytochromatia bacterium]